MSAKPCPFCGRVHTYVLRAASSREVWSPGRYCPGCDSIYRVESTGGLDSFGSGELIVRKAEWVPDSCLGRGEALWSAYEDEFF